MTIPRPAGKVVVEGSGECVPKQRCREAVEWWFRVRKWCLSLSTSKLEKGWPSSEFMTFREDDEV